MITKREEINGNVRLEGKGMTSKEVIISEMSSIIPIR